MKEIDLIERLKAHRPKLFKNEGVSSKEAFNKFSVTTEEYARKASRRDMYDLQWRMGSAAAHSDAKSLEDGHFELDEEGTVREFKNEPYLEDLDMVIHTLCEVVIDAARFVGRALEYDIPEDELRSIEEELETCHKDTGSVSK